MLRSMSPFARATVSECWSIIGPLTIMLLIGPMKYNDHGSVYTCARPTLALVTQRPMSEYV
jgi:hypothetical protein